MMPRQRLVNSQVRPEDNPGAEYVEHIYFCLEIPQCQTCGEAVRKRVRRRM